MYCVCILNAGMRGRGHPVRGWQAVAGSEEAELEFGISDQ